MIRQKHLSLLLFLLPLLLVFWGGFGKALFADPDCPGGDKASSGNFVSTDTGMRNVPGGRPTLSFGMRSADNFGFPADEGAGAAQEKKLKQRITRNGMAGSQKKTIETLDEKDRVVHRDETGHGGEKFHETDIKYGEDGSRVEKETVYRPDGTRVSETTTGYNAEDAKTSEQVDYPDGRASETRVDRRTGNPIEQRTYYDPEKTKLKSDTQFDPREANRPIWRKDYTEDGKIRSNTTYQPGSSKPLHQTNYQPDGTVTETNQPYDSK